MFIGIKGKIFVIVERIDTTEWKIAGISGKTAGTGGRIRGTGEKIIGRGEKIEKGCQSIAAIGIRIERVTGKVEIVIMENNIIHI
jgi:hypothetical protein